MFVDLKLIYSQPRLVSHEPVTTCLIVIFPEWFTFRFAGH
jgi:hypothetical protein